MKKRKKGEKEAKHGVLINVSVCVHYNRWNEELIKKCGKHFHLLLPAVIG